MDDLLIHGADAITEDINLQFFHWRKAFPVAVGAGNGQGFHELDCSDLDLVVLENVGNLVCPAEFDTGAVKNITILSVPEGHDKPLKYPLMYEVCDLLIVSKTDVMPYFDFDAEKVVAYAKMRNPEIAVLFVSAKTGEGVDAVAEWLLAEINKWNR